MKFDVKYLAYGLNFQGKGCVFVNETALIFQGNMPKFPKFNLGGIFFPVWQKVTYVSTTTTVPYATIIHHERPSFLRKAHEIIYLLPNGKKDAVRFQITKSKKRHNKMFTSQLEENLAIAKSFVSS